MHYFSEGTSHLKILLYYVTFGLLFKPSRQDLKETFIDSGVMSAIKEWLSPLPDRSLPALKIREELLKILQEVWNWLLTTLDLWFLYSFTYALGKCEVINELQLLPMGCAVKHARKQPAQQMYLCKRIYVIWPCLPVSVLYPNWRVTCCASLNFLPLRSLLFSVLLKCAVHGKAPHTQCRFSGSVAKLFAWVSLSHTFFLLKNEWFEGSSTVLGWYKLKSIWSKKF